jgi:hypothetical protein
VNADADRVGFHVALSDHEHGVDFHLLGALDLAADLSPLVSRSQRTSCAPGSERETNRNADKSARCAERAKAGVPGSIRSEKRRRVRSAFD